MSDHVWVRYPKSDGESEDTVMSTDGYGADIIVLTMVRCERCGRSNIMSDDGHFGTEYDCDEEVARSVVES